MQNASQKVGREISKHIGNGVEKDGKSQIGAHLSKTLGDVLSAFKFPQGKIDWLLLLGAPAIGGVVQIAIAGIGQITAILGQLSLAAAGAGVALGGIGASLVVGFAPILLALKSGTQEAKVFKLESTGLLNSFKAIGDATIKTLAPGLLGALKNLQAFIPVFSEFGAGQGQIVGQTALFATSILTSAKNMALFRGAFTGVHGVFVDLQKVVGLVADILPTIFAAVVPIAQRFAASIATLAQKFHDFIAAKGAAGLTTIFNQWFNAAAQVMRILGNIADAVLHILNVGASTSGDTFNRFELFTKQFDNWTKSVEGNHALEGFFNRSRLIIAEVAGIIGRLAKALFSPLKGGGQVGSVVEILDTIRTKWMPPLAEVIDTVRRTQTGGLNKLVTEIGNFIQVLADNPNVVGGLLKGFSTNLTLFTLALTGLNAVLGTGVGKKLLGFLAPIIPWLFIASKLNLFKLGKDLFNLFKGFGKTAALEAQTLAMKSAAGSMQVAADQMTVAADQMSAAGLEAAGAGEGFAVGATAISAGSDEIAGSLVGVEVAAAPLELTAGLIAILVAAFAALVVITVLMVQRFGVVKGVFQVLAALIGGPIVLGFLLLYHNVQFVRDAVDGLINTITNFVSTAGSALLNFITAVPGFFARLPGDIGKIFSDIGTTIGSAFSTAGSAVLGFFERLPDQILQALSGLGDIIGRAFQNALDFLFSTLPTMLGQIVAFFILLPINILNALAGLTKILGDAFLNALPGVLSALGNFAVSVVNFFLNLPAQIGTALAAIPGIVSGIFTGTIPVALSAAGSLISSVVRVIAGAAAAVGIAALSVVNAIIGALSRLPALAGQAISSFGSFMTNVIVGAIGLLLNAVQRFLAPILGALGQFPARARAAISNFASAITGVVIGAIGIVLGAIGRLVSAAVVALGQLVARARGAVSGFGSAVAGVISGAWGAISGAITGLIGRVLGAVGDLGGKIRQRLSGLGGEIRDAITGAFKSAWNAVVSRLPSIHQSLGPLHIDFDPGSALHLAMGEIVRSPTLALIGEAGTETVIPNTRPRQALALMRQSGLDRLVLANAGSNQTASGQGVGVVTALNIEQATFNEPVTADLVAARVRSSLRLLGVA